MLILGAAIAITLLVKVPETAGLLNIGRNDEARLAALEAQVSALRGRTEALAGLDERLSALESAKNDIVDVPPDAPDVDVDALTRRIAALEARPVPAERPAGPDKATTDRMAALVMLSLSQAVNSGARFSEEAALAEKTPGIDAVLPPAVTIYADRGIARREQLLARLPPILAELETSAGPPDADRSLPARWLAEIKRMVVVRSLTAEPGTDRSAVLSRLRAAIAKGDLSSAADEIAALPDDKTPAVIAARTLAAEITARMTADQVLVAKAHALLHPVGGAP